MLHFMCVAAVSGACSGTELAALRDAAGTYTSYIIVHYTCFKFPSCAMLREPRGVDPTADGTGINEMYYKARCALNMEYGSLFSAICEDLLLENIVL
ncbi:MAG: hypothetical protein Q4D38_06915 [Planctomycetia bacterium]|nr:hypothetical protein [Planctomycetia bacterium]